MTDKLLELHNSLYNKWTIGKKYIPFKLWYFKRYIWPTHLAVLMCGSMTEKPEFKVKSAG